MIEITEAEERTYRYYLETGKIARVMLLANRSADAIRKQLEKMVGLGLLQHDGKGYSPTGAEYTVKKSTTKTKAKRPSAYKMTNAEKLIPPHVTKDQIEYIRGHYEILTRSKLVERTGLSKIDLNNTIIGLGLSKERVEDYAESNKGSGKKPKAS